MIFEYKCGNLEFLYLLAEAYAAPYPILVQNASPTFLDHDVNKIQFAAQIKYHVQVTLGKGTPCAMKQNANLVTKSSPKITKHVK